MPLKYVPYQRKPLVSAPTTHQKGREEVDFFYELLPVTAWPIFYSVINVSLISPSTPHSMDHLLPAATPKVQESGAGLGEDQSQKPAGAAGCHTGAPGRRAVTRSRGIIRYCTKSFYSLQHKDPSLRTQTLRPARNSIYRHEQDSDK